MAVDAGPTACQDAEDLALVERARAGERRAFSALVGRHHAAVYRACYRILGDPDDAADATQEAFIRAYTKLGTFAGRSAFRTWLLRVAMNLSLNARTRRPPEVPLDEGRAGAMPGPEGEVLRLESAAQVHGALRHLAPSHRAAVVLRDLEGYSYAEVAAILGVPEGTAKGWAHRGRERLKGLLR